MVRQLAAMLMLLAVLFAASPASAASGEVGGAQPVVLCSTDSPPLSTPDHTGHLDEVLKEAFRRAGQPLRLAMTPSERGLINANNGSADGDANRIAGLEKLYPNLVRVPEPNMSYEFVALARKPLDVKDWSDLKPLRVGFITGWKILEENVPTGNVIKAEGLDQLLTLLAAGRVDVALCERKSGQLRAEELGLKDVRVLEPSLARRDMFIYLNRRHADLVPRLAAALRSMKADGTHAALFAKRKPR